MLASQMSKQKVCTHALVGKKLEMALHSCLDIESRIDCYSTVNSPALAIYFQSAASIDLSNCWSSHGRLHLNRKHGLTFASAFMLRRCRRVCRVAVSHEEYCFLKGSRDCVTLNLTKSTTVEQKHCEPRIKMIGSEGDCGVNHGAFTLWGLYAYPRNSKRKKSTTWVSLHSPAEQLPHNKVEKLVIALNWATCNILNECSWSLPTQMPKYFLC